MDSGEGAVVCDQEADGELMSYIFIQTEAKGCLVRVRIDDVFYVESASNYLKINLEKQCHSTYLTITEMEEALPAENFMRVHRSFLVNMNRIISVTGAMITLENGKYIFAGPNYKEPFLERINAMVLKSKRR
jgi:DNA-binding LytR/AlgR family response regulator